MQTQMQVKLKSIEIAAALFAAVLHSCFACPNVVHAQAPLTKTQSAELARRLNEINELNKRNDYDRALPLAEETAAKFPQSYEAHVLRGVCSHYMEEEDKAISEFKWALARQPKDWSVLQFLGLTYFQIGKNELALKYIDESIVNAKRNSERASSYMHKREILKRMKRNIEAEQAADNAVKLFAAPHWILERMKLRVLNGHWQGAIDDGNLVFEKMPKFKEKVFSARAKSLIGLKKYPQAEKVLKELIKEYPDSREHHQDLLHLYEVTGKTDLAFREKAMIKKLDSTFE